MKLYLLSILLIPSLLYAQIGGNGISSGTKGNKGTVTNTGGNLQSNHILIGAGGSDISSSTAYFLDSFNFLAGVGLNLSCGLCTSTDGDTIAMTGSNLDQISISLQNTSSNKAYQIAATGSNSTVPGLDIYDALNGATLINLYSLDATHPISANGSLAVIGFSSNNDSSVAALDTGISRSAANSFAFGNGTQNDASATIKAAAFNGAVGTITPASGSFTTLNSTGTTALGNTTVNSNLNTTGNANSATLSIGSVATLLKGTTASIGGGALLAGTCATGTATVTGAIVGHPVALSASDGTLPNALSTLAASVTATNTVTVQVCAIAAVTPTAVTYNVTVL